MKIDTIKWVSDGCTMFPDKVLTRAGQLCCCYHDQGFVINGSFIDRWYNDLDFFYCIMASAKEYSNETEASKFRAFILQSICPMMWAGVRIGGIPFWYFRKVKNRKIFQELDNESA